MVEKCWKTLTAVIYLSYPSSSLLYLIPVIISPLFLYFYLYFWWKSNTVVDLPLRRTLTVYTSNILGKKIKYKQSAHGLWRPIIKLSVPLVLKSQLWKSTKFYLFNTIDTATIYFKLAFICGIIDTNR